MTTNTIQFFNVATIPLYPTELAVLDFNTGSAAKLPANNVITEIIFKKASNTTLTADAMLTLGVAGDPTLFNPVLPVTTDELNAKGHVVVYPEIEAKQASSTSDRNLVITAGLKAISDGQVNIIVKYKGVPSGIYANSGLGKQTTIL